MRHFTTIFIGLVLLLLTMSIHVAGQFKWGIDCRPSLSFPTKLFCGNRLDPGFGFDAVVTYNFAGNLSAYYGWGWLSLPQNKTSGNSLNVERMGSSMGLKYEQPLNSYNLEFYTKGGVVNQHVKLQMDKENNVNSSHRWGWQIEAGLSLPLEPEISLQPGLRYSSLRGRINQDGSAVGFNLNDLSAGIVLSLKFGRRSK